MLKKTLALCAFLSLTAHSYAAGDHIGLRVGAAVKTTSRMNIGPDRARVDIVAEGAGALTSRGTTVRFYALCSVVDTLVGTRQVDGAGDCELRSTGGGVAYLHFRSDPDHGDRGRMTIDGGSGDFAGIHGEVAVDVSVNPSKVGKPVFFVEDRVESSAQ
jgi:hypothetical protein